MLPIGIAASQSLTEEFGCIVQCQSFCHTRWMADWLDGLTQLLTEINVLLLWIKKIVLFIEKWNAIMQKGNI